MYNNSAGNCSISVSVTSVAGAGASCGLGTGVESGLTSSNTLDNELSHYTFNTVTTSPSIAADEPTAISLASALNFVVFKRGRASSATRQQQSHASHTPLQVAILQCQMLSSVFQIQ